jgi:hypothetical protein
VYLECPKAATEREVLLARQMLLAEEDDLPLEQSEPYGGDRALGERLPQVHAVKHRADRGAEVLQRDSGDGTALAQRPAALAFARRIKPAQLRVHCTRLRTQDIDAEGGGRLLTTLCAVLRQQFEEVCVALDRRARRVGAGLLHTSSKILLFGRPASVPQLRAEPQFAQSP